ncbi:MAG: DUF1289 domain-containing protein [Melioribacteraceae bacterium]|nr:DUF1289 domain-containing protein [Melioribacteraceae bacterium]MCF8263733.1 DUF1289 domain-containing protein [Melioribacteraceae bacterium]MCF8432649.1 DUF1289 domain-containing protein [Melioribacteraceae bacterium]
MNFLKNGINDLVDLDVLSPCESICEIDDDLNVCVGCLRTVDEIEAWPHFSNTDKLFVYKVIEKRKTFLEFIKDGEKPDLSNLS